MQTKQKNAPPMRPAGGPGHMVGIQKAKNFKKSFKQLIQHLKPSLPIIIIALIFAIIGTVFNIIGPRLLGKMTNEIQLSVMENRNIKLETITRIGVTMVFLYSFSLLFSSLQSFIMNFVTQKISKNLRTDISTKINRLPLKYFDHNSYGDVLSRVTNDVDTMSQSLNQSLSQFISSVTMIIGILVMMIDISPQLTLVAVIAVPISTLLMRLIIRNSQKYFKKHQESLGLINSNIEEVYSGQTVIKTFNAHGYFKKDFLMHNEELTKSAWKSQFFSSLMQPITNFISNLSYVAICVFGGILALRRGLLIGDIQSMLIYVRRINQPLGQIAQSASSMQAVVAAAERVFEFLNEPEMTKENPVTSLNQIEGNVDFRNVRFGYNEEKIVIKNFTAQVKKGQKIAIVGPTGAGKTTIVNLLMRFYELDEGDILIDGVSIKDLSRENVHRLFGMVLQDTWLFKGTIFDNLVYGQKNITLDQVKAACKLANVDHFIESLPDSYQMILEEETSISAGQKQLFTIARAMIENAPMLILDEATSSVDTRTEILIQKAMDNLMKGRTSFVIAHRLSTIKNADLILVMNEGDIIETGTHETLLASNGFYADLYNSQFEKLEHAI